MERRYFLKEAGVPAAALALAACGKTEEKAAPAASAPAPAAAPETAAPSAAEKEGLGQVAGAHPQQVGKLVNRLLYLLNEDSGSNGWGAAAALGEIGRNQIPLVKEIIPMFVGFLEEPFSQESMLWGVGRLAEVQAELLHEVLPEIVPFLTNPKPQLRGLAAWGLGRAWYRPAAEAIHALTGDDHPVQLYDRGRLLETTVGQVALEALAGLT